MQTRILDVDGSLLRQPLLRQTRPIILPMREWGPRLRLACRHGSFRGFEQRLAELAGCTHDAGTFLTFLGSGDFHHLSLALLRRLRQPCHLLVIDNHPDWMRGVPLLHCGTWLYHAAQLPHVQRIFHVGGAVDFDNAYRWLAPWPLIRSGKIVVVPARQSFCGRHWEPIKHLPLRRSPDEPASYEDIAGWLEPYQDELAAYPLYVSVDKDVLCAAEAVVNWDSGHLTTTELLAVLAAFVEAAEGQMAGMDVVGDWSPVRVHGVLRRFLHWSEHPSLTIDPDDAAERNQTVNVRLMSMMDVRTSANGVRADSRQPITDGR